MNNEEIEYDIICKPSSADLSKSINEKIKSGWKPQGGVCVTYGINIQLFLAQAIIRVKPIDK